MKRLGIILLLTCSMIGIWANPLAKVYQHDDPILELIEYLSIEAGIVPQHTDLPTTGHALMRQLVKIDGKKISPKSQKLLDDLKDLLLDQPYSVPAQFKVIFNPEIYANQREEAISHDWVHGYNNRPPILYAQAESIFADSVYGIFSYGIARTESKMDFSGIETNYPFPSGSTSETNLQNSYPHTAFLGISGDRFSVVVGRDTLSWGRGNTGNLVLGDHVPYHDFFQFSMNNDKAKYSFLVVPMNELDDQGKAIVPSSTNTLFFNTLQRLFIAHRLSIDVTPRLRLTIGEGTLFYTDKLDLRMFSPVMLMHNFQNFFEVNNTMHLEVEYAPSANWSIYAQFLVDQLQTKGEQDQINLPPNAHAGLIGADFVKVLPSGRISGSMEGAYTSPFLYLRAGDNTGIFDNEGDPQDQHNLDLVHAVSMRNAVSGTSWLGYQYGPDSIVGSFNLRFDHDNDFGASGILRFIVQGERGLKIYGKDQFVELVPAEDINMLAPSGDNIDYILVPSIHTYMVLPETDIKIYNSLYFVNKWNNYGHTLDLQMVLGLEYSLTF